MIYLFSLLIFGPRGRSDEVSDCDEVDSNTFDDTIVELPVNVNDFILVVSFKAKNSYKCV